MSFEYMAWLPLILKWFYCFHFLPQIRQFINSVDASSPERVCSS
jgi:hypothetical protein